MEPPHLGNLQIRLGYQFNDLARLQQALTHRSFGQPNNERLEFLGDSILNCCVAALLFSDYSTLDEGDLSRVRANLVRQPSLVELAQGLELGTCIRLGDGERKSGGFRRPSILADTLEAIIGAVYLDGGFSAAEELVARLFEPVLRSIDPQTLGKDAKTLLQEQLQGQGLALPVYSVIATHGAAHNQLFEVQCAVPSLNVQVTGQGASRRAAEQAAALLALESLKQVAQRVPLRPGRKRKASTEAGIQK
jgi:ribonuclease III